MKKILLIICAAFIAVGFSGCFIVSFESGNSGSVTGTGERESYTINAGEYSMIRIADSSACELRYYAAPSNTVMLEVQPNIREYCVVEVIDGELVFRTTRRISTNGNSIPILTVYTPTLNSLNITGACTFTTFDKITSDSFNIKISGACSGKIELDVNSLYVDISGAGDFGLSGRADTAEISMSGAGDLGALPLQTRDAKVSLTGAGTIRISCSDNLQINGSGMGTIEYRGSPSINQYTRSLSDL